MKRVGLFIVVFLIAYGLTRGALHSGTQENTTVVDHGGTGGAIVTGTEAERNGSTTTTHYADCALPGGKRYRVQVPAQVEYQLHQGQPCPGGPQLPIAQDQYPQLYHDLQRQMDQPLPYKVPANPSAGGKTVPDSYDPGFHLPCDYGIDFPSLPEAQEHYRECFPGQPLPPNLR